MLLAPTAGRTEALGRAFRYLLRVAVAVSACVAVSLLLRDEHSDHRHGVVTVGLTVLAIAPAVWLRGSGAALAALWVSVVATLLDYSMAGPLLLALGLIGLATSRPDAQATAIVGVLSGLAVAVVAIGTADTQPVAAMIGGFAVGILPVFIGERFRAERARALEATEAARRVEQLRDRDVQRAVVEERLRIARDLHDITGHHLSAISLQAAGAGQMTTDPGARAALQRIHGLTSVALKQTRRALGVLRQEQELAALAPPARLAHAQALLDPVRASGIDVQLHVRGEARELSETVEMCAYRIIQESLTNVMRHAQARSVHIDVAYEEASLAVIVGDDGAGGRGGPVRSGGGIEGMRERVALVGGALSAEPGAAGGWTVRATLPLEESP